MLTTNRSKGVIGFVLVVMVIMFIMLDASAQRIGPVLNQPADGSTVSGNSVTLQWFFIITDPIYDRYHIQVGYDEAMSMVLFQKDDISLTINSFEVSSLPQDGTRFYWRVRINGYPDSEWSEVWSFTSASSVITPTEPHPADTNEDWRIIMDEAVPYISGWQQGTNLIGDALHSRKYLY